MVPSDGKAISDADETTAGFALKGGRYGVAAVATWGGGSAKLEILLPDGTTWVSVGSSTDFTDDGFALVDIPPGQYRVAIATATGVYASIDRVPLGG